MGKTTQGIGETFGGRGGGLPSPGCDICDRPMEHVATLPETFRFPMQYFYRCLACRKVAKIEAH
jgi:hypothetical protein